VSTNKAHEALQNYTSEIQQIVSCVSDKVFYVYPKGGGRQLLTCASGGYFRVTRRDDSHLFIDINQEIEEPTETNEYRVSTRYYLYSIADSDQNDLIGFHYHPELNEDPVLYPHIHAYANKDERFLPLNLHRRHIPSGRIALEDVIRWLIDELEMKPNRDDWDAVLTSAREKFKSNQSWS
jgi:hypothetical protein